MPISVPLTEWNPQLGAVVQELNGLFPGFSWGTYPGHDPNQARAADAMVPGWATAAGRAKGQALADYIWDNRTRYNIWYVIFNGRIISMTRPEKGWLRYYAANDPNPSKSHKNHVHLSVYTPKGTGYDTVWLDRLLPGVTDSDSVRVVQRALKVPVTGVWDSLSVEATKAYQRSLGDAEQYCDGNLGKWQAASLLSARGVWATVRTDPSGEPLPVDPPVVDVPAPDRPADLPPTPPVVELPKTYPAPASNEVYLDKMQAGVTGSDTAWYVRAALRKVGVTVELSGDYPHEEVKAYQRDVLKDDPKFCDGILGPTQATRLFKDAKMPVKIYRSSVSGGLVNPDPKAPSVPVKAFSVPMREWGGNAGRTLLQGLRIHELSGTRIVNQADTVRGQRRQDIVWRMHDRANDYLGAVWVKNVGHGSTTDVESTGQQTFNLWFRNEATRRCGFIKVRVGQRGVVSDFTPVTALPYGDPAIDQGADLICIRYGNRYRGYRLSDAKKGITTKLWDFTIPRWGARFQGHLVHDGKLYVHRDVKTKGASRAHEFNYGGRQTSWLDTTGMGDEAEGFVVVSGRVCVVKRTGGDNPGRVLQVTPWK